MYVWVLVCSINGVYPGSTVERYISYPACIQGAVYHPEARKPKVMCACSEERESEQAPMPASRKEVKK